MDSGDVFNRGLEDPNALSDPEMVVFVILRLEALADMEGWDHFFMYHFDLYERLKWALAESANQKSLDVVQRFEDFLRSHDVPLEGEAIEDFLLNDDRDYRDDQWHDTFESAREERWSNVKSYLRRKGYELRG